MIEISVEGVVHARPAQGLLMIVPQVLGIIMIVRGQDDGARASLLRDQGGLAVERARGRREGCAGGTVEVRGRAGRRRPGDRRHPRVVLRQNASFLETDKRLMNISSSVATSDLVSKISEPEIGTGFAFQ